MKMVMAVIRPERLQCVKDALRDIGINGMTISHVTGRGEQMGLTFTTRVGEFVVDEIEKVKIESVVDDGDVERVIETIRRSAETGNPGDGRIFVIPVERSIRIRTGDD
ncbi:MAG: transcriptional regulator [Methanomassiliicoccales archaeon Mx-03]|nr:P-II family nitrogen regulator [Methanomassiliicoccaceae archaeon DOK]TQS80522.1 MAG: transcriptional regulator [Methanomassiliicoccales archaeon Mx-03]